MDENKKCSVPGGGPETEQLRERESNPRVKG